MPFTVDDFKTNVHELARQYQFEAEVVFPLPVGNDKVGTEFVNILVYSTTMPGRTVAPTNNTSFMGQPYKLASDIRYNDWNLNFRVDDDMRVLKMWRSWVELIHGTSTNIAAFPSQYKSNINLYRLDGAGNRIIAITLFGAWPKLLAQNGNFDTKNRQPIEATVTIAYDNNRLKIL